MKDTTNLIVIAENCVHKDKYTIKNHIYSKRHDSKLSCTLPNDVFFITLTRSHSARLGVSRFYARCCRNRARVSVACTPANQPRIVVTNHQHVTAPIDAHTHTQREKERASERASKTNTALSSALCGCVFSFWLQLFFLFFFSSFISTVLFYSDSQNEK